MHGHRKNTVTFADIDSWPYQSVKNQQQWEVPIIKAGRSISYISVRGIE